MNTSPAGIFPPSPPTVKFPSSLIGFLPVTGTLMSVPPGDVTRMYSAPVMALHDRLAPALKEFIVYACRPAEHVHRDSRRPDGPERFEFIHLIVEDIVDFAAVGGYMGRCACLAVLAHFIRGNGCNNFRLRFEGGHDGPVGEINLAFYVPE